MSSYPAGRPPRGCGAAEGPRRQARPGRHRRGRRLAGVAERLEATLTEAGLVAPLHRREVEPRVGNVDAGAATLADFGADAMVAVDRGSPIDTAKIIGAAAANGGSAHAFMAGEKAITTTDPLIAVPTRPAAGAESPRVSVLIDTPTARRRACSTAPRRGSRSSTPSLMTGMPPRLTAATGMDALSPRRGLPRDRGQRVLQTLAEQSMTLVARWLEPRWPTNCA